MLRAAQLTRAKEVRYTQLVIAVDPGVVHYVQLQWLFAGLCPGKSLNRLALLRCACVIFAIGTRLGRFTFCFRMLCSGLRYAEYREPLRPKSRMMLKKGKGSSGHWA
jgi:hypothetical protein